MIRLESEVWLMFLLVFCLILSELARLSHNQVWRRRDPSCESGAASHVEEYLNFAASKLWNPGPADGVTSSQAAKQRVFCSLNKIYGSAFMPTFPPHTLCLWQYASLSWITIITPFPRTILPLLQHWLPLEALNCPQTRMQSKHNLSKYIFTAVLWLTPSEM